MVIPYVPTDRLARMQLLDQRAMPNQCDIISDTPGGGVNPDGSSMPPGTSTLAGISCRMTTGATATETLIAMRLTDVGNSVLFVPIGTPITPKDRVVFRGSTYQVLGTNDGDTMATSLAVALKRIS